MPYKDAEKQKEANRAANKRYREHTQGITANGITEQGITHHPPDVMPDIKPMTDRELLDFWAAGNGTMYQQSLGWLAEQYR